MGKDIHIKMDDSWYERWQKCGKYFGQRSAVLRSLVKKAVVQMEKQPDIVEELKKEEGKES